MERSEPSLIPEWLKTGGSLTGGSSTSHSDDPTASRIARNKSFVSSNNHDFGRSSSSDRTTSSYFRRSSSSNGSHNVRSYSNFGRNQSFGRNQNSGRNHIEKVHEKDKHDSLDRDKLFLDDRRHRDFFDPLGDTLSGKFEIDGSRQSQSTTSGKHGEIWPKKVVSGGNSNNGLVTKGGPVGGVSKATFERDFPSLGAEERSVVSDVGRVPSPGLSSAIQSLPIGNSPLIGGEKWTSALAEVPTLVVGGNGLSSVQHAASSSSSSVSMGTTTGLNMAEAVAQGPSRAQIAPQLSVETQRLEELAIKQSRQLIPVTPSLPKTLVLATSDKLKSKVGQQQHPILSSLPDRHSPRGPVKGDVSKVSNVGKLQVLKPVREKNSVIPVVKDTSSPTSGNKVVSSTLLAAPSVLGPATTRVLPHNSILDHKPVLEKRPTPQARSRNDFFNLVRKKSMASSSSIADSSSANSSSVLDNGESPSFSDKLSETEVALPPDTPQSCDTQQSANLGEHKSSEDRGEATQNGDVCDAQKYDTVGKTHPSSDPLFSEEEEAAFLRSLGWEENSDEGGLTEEEITAFFRDVTKYINSKSSLKILQGVQPKYLLPFESQIGGIGGLSSGLSSSDTKLES